MQVYTCISTREHTTLTTLPAFQDICELIGEERLVSDAAVPSSSDNLISARIVTSSGKLLQAARFRWFLLMDLYRLLFGVSFSHSRIYDADADDAGLDEGDPSY